MQQVKCQTLAAKHREVAVVTVNYTSNSALKQVHIFIFLKFYSESNQTTSFFH